jgi:hypothetical protein
MQVSTATDASNHRMAPGNQGAKGRAQCRLLLQMLPPSPAVSALAADAFTRNIRGQRQSGSQKNAAFGAKVDDIGPSLPVARVRVVPIFTLVAP